MKKKDANTISKKPLELLMTLASITAEHEQEDFILQHPVLLAPSVQEALTNEILSLAPKERATLESILMTLRNKRRLYDMHPEQYPIGKSPVELLWKRFVDGEISAKQAEALAQKPNITDLLSPVYIRALSLFCNKTAREGRSWQWWQWQQMLQLQKLLLSSLSKMSDYPEWDSIQKIAGLEWAEAATIALFYVPDGRIYRSALSVTEGIVERAAKTRDQEVLGSALHRLGVLHLDPYTAGRTSTNYEQQISDWMRRLPDEIGEEIGSIPQEEWRMPSPKEALQKAEKYLRQAIDARDGPDKGLSLKALIQTLEWRGNLGESTDQQEIILLSRQALSLLEPDRDPHQMLYVLGTLVRHGEKVDHAVIDKILKNSMDEYIRRLGSIQTIDLVLQTVSALQEDSPLRCLDLMRKARSLFELYGSEDHRKNRLYFELNLISTALAPADLPSQPPREGLRAVAQQLYERAKIEQWDIQTLSAGLISLAARASEWNEETTALGLLDNALRLAPVFTDDYTDALAYLRASLLIGVGVNGVNARSWSSAIEAYTHALQIFLNLNLLNAAMDCLRRIDNLASEQDTNVALNVVMGIASLALRLETVIGKPATRLIQRICKRTVAGMGLQEIDPNLLFFLLQMAKGLPFATALYAGSGYHWKEDDYGKQLLEQVRGAEAALPTQNPDIAPLDSKALLDENTLLTAYIQPSDQRSGGSEEERLANLQHSYDAYLYKRLVAGLSGDELLYLTTADVQAALDERTVLLSYYLGASADGRISTYLLVMTREEVRVYMITQDFPDSLVSLGDKEREILMNPIALLVQGLRQNLESETGPLPLSLEAADTLAIDLRRYLGNFVEHLDELLAAGKDHLCIVPHGPLHYYPFHLLGEQGKTLAHQWIVTYLPNLHLLISQRGRPAVSRHRDHTITAIGLGFDETKIRGLSRPYDSLAPIPQSISESQKVAEIFGVKPVPEEEATEKKLSEALERSRYVHLSTHGRHNVEAPAFQCLYLTPDGESDGVLYAHELLSLDLRGLEVLTLSACETALGRFDSGDNLRGLPASLLLSGVSTLIGTLWPVEANASECFFSAFYRELKGGATRLDAFAAAQKETRVAFPKYRDWGPFYLVGDWR